MKTQTINSQQSLDALIAHIRSQFEEHKYLKVSLSTGKQRSLTQNSALHLYCQHLADALNDGGLDFRTMIKEEIDVPWTMELVKDHLWRPIQKAVTGKDSTTKPLRDEYGKIYDVLNKHLGEKKGLFVAWPTKEDIDK